MLRFFKNVIRKIDLLLCELFPVLPKFTDNFAYKNSTSPTGFISEIFVLYKNSWICLNESLRKEIQDNSSKPLHTPVYANYKQNVRLLKGLYEALHHEGFKVHGQIFPPSNDGRDMEYAILQDADELQQASSRYKPNYIPRTIDEDKFTVHCMKLESDSEHRGYYFYPKEDFKRILVQDAKEYFRINPNKRYFHKR